MPETWLLKAQDAFLTGKLPGFAKAQKDKNVAAFLKQVRDDFFVLWSNAESEEVVAKAEEESEAQARAAAEVIKKGNRKKARTAEKQEIRTKKIFSTHEAWYKERCGVRPDGYLHEKDAC